MHSDWRTTSQVTLRRTEGGDRIPRVLLVRGLYPEHVGWPERYKTPGLFTSGVKPPPCPLPLWVVLFLFDVV